MLVQVLKPQNHAAEHEANRSLPQLPVGCDPLVVVTDKGVSVPTRCIVECQVEVVIVPEGVVQLGYEIAVGVMQDLALELDALEQRTPSYSILSDAFYRKLSWHLPAWMLL